MSALHLWVPWLLFMWQLLWLQVQAAQPLELALDLVLMTSILPCPTEPWPCDQQNPSEMVGLESFQQEASTLPTQALEKMEPSPSPQEASAQLLPQEAPAPSTVSSEPLKFLSVHQEIPDQHPPYPEYVQSSIQQRSSALTHVCPAGVQPSPVQQKVLAQPPKSSMDIVAQPSAHHEVTVSPLHSGEVQHSVLPIINVKDVDLGVLMTSQPSKKIEPPATEKEVLVHSPKSTEEVKPPSQQETPAQPTSEADATALQQTTASPKHPEVTLPLPELVQAQQPTLSEIAVQYVNLGLTITPKPTSEADATALQQTTAPSKHPEVTLLLPEPVQAQQPMLSEVTVQSVDLEVVKTQHPESSETVPPMTEQSATVNICELCTCSNGTLSCIGLGPKQRLHRVPVPEPNTYNGTFTILNLQGNSISYIDKDTWKSYHVVEKLILSGNNLRELHKDSFEGLLSLQYLDLSCNKIQFIESNTFESLPFLQYLNLSHNLITELSFGTFQAWHGMQFLHKLTTRQRLYQQIKMHYSSYSVGRQRTAQFSELKTPTI
ncbi:PREDICTED: leucine-rich repeat-containing protein 37A2-like [Miniopterus natalensis]|uniref:leucine-rich repeat-containing protein 37A2-like n=1 Tax=Miniopterus natalensis TaxID=291302 RepID=UPI0007A6CB51|nr:PREDICTED: leucine-rich repeat-containing protein 37A2-like [Miniopterus natalensis]